MKDTASERLYFPAASKPNETSDMAALQERVLRAEEVSAHQALQIRLLAEVLDSDSLEVALDTFAGTLKEQFACDRVAIALLTAGDLVLSAVSQQAVIKVSSSEAHLLVEAMQEASAQESIICWPPISEELGVFVAHRALAGRRQSALICSVPLYARQKLFGVFLLERRGSRGFPVKNLERLAVCMAPLLLLHKKADRSWWSVFRSRLRQLLERHLGSEHTGVRALTVVFAVALVSSMSITMNWQLVAPAELLSNERRLVAAPQDGFVSEILVTAGDSVVEGQVVARLDRREIELEAVSRDSEIAMADAEFRAALASYDRQATGIARARLTQVRARREGIEEQIKRTELISPINGLVIAADVDRTAGAAVSRGETLFEIAPSSDFEVHVMVSEADVYNVFEGQLGMLSLRAKPGDGLPIVVESIYPVAEAKDGENRFRVKATLSDPADSLRPGQSGVVRLEAGRMSILGVLTRRFNRALAELWWRVVG